MNYTDLLKGAIGIIGLAVAAVIALWKMILNWATDSLFPWIKRNLPEYIEIVREAFTQLDDVISPIRRGIKIAWQRLRQRLLKMATHLERKSSSVWVSKTTSWVIKALESKQIVKVETEVEVDWDDLPADIREDYIRMNKKSADINVTETRDKQLEMIN